MGAAPLLGSGVGVRMRRALPAILVACLALGSARPLPVLAGNGGGGQTAGCRPVLVADVKVDQRIDWGAQASSPPCARASLTSSSPQASK